MKKKLKRKLNFHLSENENGNFYAKKKQVINAGFFFFTFLYLQDLKNGRPSVQSWREMDQVIFQLYIEKIFIH